MSNRLSAATARPFSRFLLSVTASGALLASALIAVPAAAAVPQPAGESSFEPGRYVVTLTDDAVATYDGDIAGFPATTPGDGDQLNARRAPAQSYSDYLTAQQQDVAASVGTSVDYSYTMALNGFSTTLTAKQAAALAADKSVAAITRDEMLTVSATPSTEFLGLEGENGVWASVGGPEEAGAGVVVGVLDTGIAPENPSFAGDALGTDPGSEPYLTGDDTTSYAKADGQTFSGVCQEGVQFTVDDCNTKIIGARYYLSGFQASNIGDASTGTGEFASPRDGNGHGSHTASTAAGNYGVESTVLDRDFGPISGVAPAAKIAAYKVCWTAKAGGADGCTTTDILAAINDAVRDGVDVLNYSIGGGAAQTTFSPTDEAFLGAAAAGVFVAASAGNSGPGASTLDNASPWITTVAASTIPSYYGTVTLGNGESFVGSSITVTDPVTGNLVNSTAVAATGDAGARADLCAPGSLDAALVPAGTVIVCDRGVVDRTAKSAEVARVGGIGMVLTNPTPSSIDPDAHSIPTVHVDARFREPIVAYAATPGATVTLTAENQTDYTPPTPALAGFSSRGPVLADGSDILKPDITAPGVAILAAGPNQESTEPSFEFLSGTSMASPHIAGLAALYFGEHPTASPSEVKSALMTTAYNTVDGEGAEITDPFAQGAGHADPTRYFSPGLLYLNGPDDWDAYLQAIGYDVGVTPVDPSDLNLASIAIGTLTTPQKVTRTVTSTQAGSFTPTIEGLAGITAVVEPQVLDFAGPGESKTYTVTLSRTTAPLDTFTSGSLTWTSGDTTVRSPIAVQPAAILAPEFVEGTGVTGSLDVTVTPGTTGDIALSSTGLSAGEFLADPTNTAPGHSGGGVTNDEVSYEVEVPTGTEFTRFELDAMNDTADVDLVVYQLNAAGEPVAGWASESGGGDEVIDLVAPEAGTYAIIAVVIADNVWDLTVTSVVTGGSALELTPPVLPGVLGVPTTYTASWSGLTPNSSYLGIVGYGSSGASTLVQVTTGEAETPEPVTPVNTAPPVISGTAQVGSTLTATTGEWDTPGLEFAFQWQVDGADIAGATGASYTVTSAEQGAALTVIVTATGAGLTTATATSAAVTILFTSQTKVTLDRLLLFSWQRATVTVKIASASPAPATGTVTITVKGRDYSAPVTGSTNGRVTFTMPKLPAGIYSVRASYSGDAAVAGSTSSSAFMWVIV